MTLHSPRALRVQIISPHTLIATALKTLLGLAGNRFDTTPPTVTCGTLTPDAADIGLIDLEDASGIECIRQAVKDLKMRVLVITGLTDVDVVDAAIAAGAMGIVRKSEQPEILFKALECVACGELWLDRVSTGRIFAELARKNTTGSPTRGGDHAVAGMISTLTRKELLIASTVGKHPGSTGQQLAELLHISEHTLRNHLSTIYSKLNLGSRMELYAFVQKNGIQALPLRIKTSQSQLS
ncbi:MAG: response regulator transcription factor [Pseudohongiella sp.]|nr:response regulator transcription factor [Pseudohongiella sp.]